MGICLGLQLLFSESVEFEKTKGLNIIKGMVKKINTNKNDFKIPHVGWNKVIYNKTNYFNSKYKNIFKDEFFYFVHSYYVEPMNYEIINSTTQYGELKFCSSILKDNIFACQFHPEKSGLKGIDLFKNFFLENKN